MKKIMMLLVVGLLAMGTAMAQDAAPSIEDLKKEQSAATKVFNTANKKYSDFVRVNMSQECKDARAALEKAEQEYYDVKIKLLQGDEATAQVANDFAAARDANTKQKNKDTDKALGVARKAFDTAWSKSGKEKSSDEAKAAIAKVRGARAAREKADAAFRASNEEAGKLWSERETANKAKSAIEKKVKAAAEAAKK